MTRALARRGAEITYLMPHPPGRDDEPGVRIRSLATPGRPVELVAIYQAIFAGAGPGRDGAASRP